MTGLLSNLLGSIFLVLKGVSLFVLSLILFALSIYPLFSVWMHRIARQYRLTTLLLSNILLTISAPLVQTIILSLEARQPIKHLSDAFEAIKPQFIFETARNTFVPLILTIALYTIGFVFILVNSKEKNKSK